jgi:hypothetical protein
MVYDRLRDGAQYPFRLTLVIVLDRDLVLAQAARRPLVNHSRSTAV